jgi:hypothetical protein
MDKGWSDDDLVKEEARNEEKGRVAGKIIQCYSVI